MVEIRKPRVIWLGAAAILFLVVTGAIYTQKKIKENRIAEIDNITNQEKILDIVIDEGFEHSLAVRLHAFSVLSDENLILEAICTPGLFADRHEDRSLPKAEYEKVIRTKLRKIISENNLVIIVLCSQQSGETLKSPGLWAMDSITDKDALIKLFLEADDSSNLHTLVLSKLEAMGHVNNSFLRYLYHHSKYNCFDGKELARYFEIFPPKESIFEMDIYQLKLMLTERNIYNHYGLLNVSYRISKSTKEYTRYDKVGTLHLTSIFVKISKDDRTILERNFYPNIYGSEEFFFSEKQRRSSKSSKAKIDYVAVLAHIIKPLPDSAILEIAKTRRFPELSEAAKEQLNEKEE